MRQSAPIFAVTLCLAIALGGAPEAAAQTIQDLHRERVMNLLTKPISTTTRTQWVHVSEQPKLTNAMLVNISRDNEQLSVYRLRALQALAFFPTKQSLQYLWQVIYSRHQSTEQKQVAMIALAGGFQTDVFDEMTVLLSDPDPRLRIAAIKGLAMIEDERVQQRLSHHVSHEPDLDVRLATDEALEEINERRAKRAAHRRSDLKLVPGGIKTQGQGTPR